MGPLLGSSGDEAALRVAFTPLHGVGHSSVIPVLRARGLEPILVEAQLPDDGVFETVKSANPESIAAFAVGLGVARAHQADLLLATDPDADRLGAMVRRPDGEYGFIDGNRLGVLMLDHVLRELSALGSEELRGGWVLTTLVFGQRFPYPREAMPVGQDEEGGWDLGGDDDKDEDEDLPAHLRD